MKTKLIPLVGDPIENLYQLGQKEAASFARLEDRVTKLLSTSNVLRHGQDILSRARARLQKKEHGFFDQCVEAYAEGLGIESSRYRSFLSLFEVAAHYGHVYPELKGLLPGCTSVFDKGPEGVTHSRLLDFPLVGIFEESPRLYYWKCEGRVPLLSYSCEGLAPLFLQVIHGEGLSFALHHKPGKTFHKGGQSIFEIAFETLFEIRNLGDVKKEMKKKISMTKWCFLLCDLHGHVQVMDIDGPATSMEAYNLNETSPLIFTNIPLQNDGSGFESYLRFSRDRQLWLKEKLKTRKNQHLLDLMTDIDDQKTRKWVHPASTLSTVAAHQVNLTKGLVDVKEGEGALVASDPLFRFSLDSQTEGQVLKKEHKLSAFEEAWKLASRAQSSFDEGNWEEAYHRLQLARVLVPHPVWKQIFQFYLDVWDYRLVGHQKELHLVYKGLAQLDLPESLRDQWLLFKRRMEKSLDLVPTVKEGELSGSYRELFVQEEAAPKPLFTAWMKILYPRLELLDIFSPHQK